jgi:hypothetical protein
MEFNTSDLESVGAEQAFWDGRMGAKSERVFGGGLAVETHLLASSQHLSANPR